ncbi:class I SAM-dependent methyltransferase [Neobacillus cucumis]|uniref:SAM-dependent methyltransferase n=1 Tax=Neobacillus cucumis TaxID=1740721 RepID=A0A2N5HJC2_9BACI|nr:methyltransferase [Neobacillus cucumis]PLS05622.1 SAM-dependent methyltransferase [Neobacillus cucumis]
MKEYYFDKLFNIKTRGEQQGFNKSLHYHRYEPTPYSALQELFRHYQIHNDDFIVDFGSGKGRLNFYLHYFYDVAVVGVEMNEDLYHEALLNQKRYVKKNGKGKIQFLCCLAEEYGINSYDNRFYFFNPFSIQVFRRVVNNIQRSLEETPREVELVLYYPSEDYIYFLEQDTAFELKMEVVVPYVYEHNPNERFLIYRLTVPNK